ncbi:uncharacterized protein PHALS_06093 [Plasmopara halstedii]|uniref:Uncharacterized protein n=1 Tax=Plasmopara halstedii TaxID=4781 RepID=A0A0P1B3Y8_PLAHL|nr:uncharacterized protein PHALS_06093 [Plasmopara halstedii]CEG48262.1 hypothetical protein PHALS_06093 [Plasmopara halstedii]|eukprot:XP_024584631.1 hypothetical protein PHALS_06093 [Plasmopara halstedii]
MFRALIRCIRKFLSRIKPRSYQQRRTENGANIDIEEALAEQIELQRRSGRALSSTASIAAALRQRPRNSIPVFSTQLGSNEQREPSDPAMKTSDQEMLSLTPENDRHSDKKLESTATTKSPVVNKRVHSSCGSSFVKISESVPTEDAEPEHEAETKNREKAMEQQSEINPRRSSIFDMRSEWI